MFLNLPSGEVVQYEVHSGPHSADPTQIYRSSFGIDVDENRFGVAMSDRVSTVGSCPGTEGYRLPNGLQHRGREKVRLINKCWSRANPVKGINRDLANNPPIESCPPPISPLPQGGAAYCQFCGGDPP